MNKPRILNDNRESRLTDRSFWIAMAVVWLWPTVLLLATFRWHAPFVWERLLWKSTWVLFAGVLQGWAIVLLNPWKGGRAPWWLVALFVVLTLASIVLLPYGLCHWDFSQWGHGGGTWNGLTSGWDYMDNLLLSYFLHAFPGMMYYCLWLGVGSEPEAAWEKDLQHDSGALEENGSFELRPGTEDDGSSLLQPGTGSGPWGDGGWLSRVWDGWELSDDYYGEHGEFDLNDEARRASEDIQQFHNSHPEVDLTDQYFWDDVLDAETDGYLERD